MGLKEHRRRKFWREFGMRPRKKYWGGFADFGDIRVYDSDVAKYVKKHMRLIDRLDIRKVSEATLYSFSILSKSVEPPSNRKNFNFRWPYKKIR